MSSSNLSIVVYGLGEDPHHRSHWAFAIHKPTEDIGNIFHVTPLYLEKLIYRFETQKSVLIRGKGSEGSFPFARLSPEQVPRASRIIGEEPAPGNGVERCQDWVLRTVISLEAEEVVPAGTSERIGGLVGQSADYVAGVSGDEWIASGDA